jgi:hypothetical protein
MKSLERGLGKVQGLPNELSDLPSVNTFPRHKENNTYNVISYFKNSYPVATMRAHLSR